MPRPTSRYPTELELEILKILWDEGPAPVRRVRDGLADYRDLAYTSVMTIMNIMAKKGYLRREKPKGKVAARGYVYHPCIEREEATSQMVEDLVDRLFEGSPAAAALHLLETSDIDEAELKELRALIARGVKE